MMSSIMTVLITLSVLISALLGRLPELSAAALSSGKEALDMCLTLCGSMAVWGGVMKIAEKSGMCELISRLLSPLTNFLFKGLREQSEAAIGYITMNITANILGLGSAATPMGLAAMVELDKLNGESAVASDWMVRFTALNTASFQLIPTTVATLRTLAGSAAPLEILPCVMISSAVSVTLAVGSTFIFGRRKAT